MHMKITMKPALVVVVSVIGVLVLAGAAIYFSLLAATGTDTTPVLFAVPKGETDAGSIADRLKEQGFIRNGSAFRLIVSRTGNGTVDAGGYMIAKKMNVFGIAKILTAKPQLVWVTVPEGLRKEEIGLRLAEALDWDAQQIHDWTYTYTAMDYDHIEGTYFPDTYLIPVNESGLDIAKRFLRRFDEVFAPYMQKFLEKNIKWTTAIRFASVIQREAAGKEDMPLISGILWNRLDKDMKLEIDATVQYARDDRDKLTSGFWKPIVPSDLTIDSKYNTYKYKGLPPFPIDNPGMDAIDAVLHPAETDCLYYLHDANRQIHCAKTYEEHKKNIDTYLK